MCLASGSKYFERHYSHCESVVPAETLASPESLRGTNHPIEIATALVSPTHTRGLEATAVQGDAYNNSTISPTFVSRN